LFGAGALGNYLIAIPLTLNLVSLFAFLPNSTFKCAADEEGQNFTEGAMPQIFYPERGWWIFFILKNVKLLSQFYMFARMLACEYVFQCLRFSS